MAIGGSMLLLGLLVWAPLPVIGIIGVILFFGHNILDIINFGAISHTVIWKLLLTSKGFVEFTPITPTHSLLIAYALLPWTGVMLLGYVFGSLYKKGVNAAYRQRTLLYTGVSLMILFILFRFFNIYGDPAPWSVQKTTALTIISFFNVTKYPCSLLYLSMTLSPALIALALVENIQNSFTRLLIVYGNVPLFYYICHWYLIRVFNFIIYLAQGFSAKSFNSSFDPPANFGLPLWGVYLVWLAVIVTLYMPCRWFGKYKQSHKQWWLSYL